MATEPQDPEAAGRSVALAKWEVAKWFMPVLYILVAYFPIKALQPIAEDLAGEDTNLTVTVSITFAFTVAISAGLLAQWRKSRRQGQELTRLRRRISTLEAELATARGLNP